MSYRFRPIFDFHSSLTKPPGMLLFKDAISFPQTTATAIWRLAHQLYDPRNFFLLLFWSILKSPCPHVEWLLNYFATLEIFIILWPVILCCYQSVFSYLESCVFICPNISFPCHNLNPNNKKEPHYFYMININLMIMTLVKREL